MYCTKSSPFLLLTTFLFIFSTFFSSSHESSSSCHAPAKPFPAKPSSYSSKKFGMEDGSENHVMMIRRSVLEGVNELVVENSSLVLASERTHRRDPLDSFNYYKGGWNISQKHYFSSVGFTAAPLFLIAAIWFLGFGICLLVLTLCHCCCQHQHYGYTRTIYLLSLVFLTLFTVAAAIGCIVLYVGQGKFHNSTTDTLNYVVQQADMTVDKLRNVSDYLEAAKNIRMNQIVLPPDIQANIERVDKEINDSANTLERKTEDNSYKIKHVLDSVRLCLIVIAAVMLLLAFLGFAFSFFGMRICVHILVIIGWILVTVIFILCGIFIIVHNIMDDSCVAMAQWVQYPSAHTALDDIIPCVDRRTAQEALNESKDVTIRLVGIVNAFINNVANLKAPPNSTPVYYNQSGPLVPLLCSPYNSDKTDRESCNANEVNLSNATEEWKKYVCQVSPSTGSCTTEGRLTPVFYDQMVSSVNVSYALHYYAPFLVDVVNCRFVREILSNITRDHCPGLSESSEMISVGLVVVSTAVMLLVTLWLFYARKRLQLEEDNEYNIAAESAGDHAGREKST